MSDGRHPTVISGVSAIIGPFETEQAARDYAIGDSGEDRLENWFSAALSEPTREEDED
jgi:hypothetical protein